MATGAQAIERIAVAIGESQNFVYRAARALREAGGDRWPQGSRGGGRSAAHVRPHHLVNLAIGIAIADTQANAPLMVQQYRELVTYGPADTSFPKNPLGPHGTLGAALDFVVANIKMFDTREETVGPNRLMDHCRTTGPLRVRLGKAGHPYARTSRCYFGCDETAEFWLPSVEPAPPAPAEIDRLAELPFKLFKVLAELWADTQAQESALSLSPSGPSPASESAGNENAAPARAAPRQPRANAADGLLDLRHSISAWRERQPARGSTPDPGACHARDPTYSLGA